MKHICCIKECNLPALVLGLCNKHWRRNKKYGSPVAVASHSGMFRGLSAEERFAMLTDVFVQVPDNMPDVYEGSIPKGVDAQQTAGLSGALSDSTGPQNKPDA